MRVFLLVCLVSLFALRSYGIVIRHDVAPGDYILRASDFSQVFYLELFCEIYDSGDSFQ